MEIILVSILYASTVSQPIAYVSSYVYSDMRSCIEDAEMVEYELMQSAPNTDSYVNVQCVIMPRST